MRSAVASQRGRIAKGLVAANGIAGVGTLSGAAGGKRRRISTCRVDHRILLSRDGEGDPLSALVNLEGTRLDEALAACLAGKRSARDAVEEQQKQDMEWNVMERESAPRYFATAAAINAL